MGRRSFIKTIVALALVGASAAGAHAKELVVGTDTSFMPFEFKQGDKYVGFDLDLWAEIAKGAGWTYKVQPMDFAGLIPALQTQNIDVALSGMTIKEERRKAIDFSDPYYDSGLAAMVQANNTTIKSIDDLNGKVIAAKTGTATIDWIKAHLKPKEIRQFPNIDQAYLALEAGRVDAAMHDTPNVLFFVNNEGKGRVKMAGAPVSGDKYGIGFPKGSPLVAKVDAELARMKADGRYAKIYKKWFGSEPPKS
ncbi:glutamine ABC transporter substrate-binding protein GlnH [Burkholderia pseudomallei]|uniref:glutamine ABC transporter substrate-binding protein GlnH n=1 Tax=Burkholderia pseudomallei TaxID=28450 RepID=UPI00051077B1|nr:glutamine ABC transporter substrate-binding protein GlnH [Burkholderia pseudomallei]KGC43672.1 bacterial extracellular solute-binding s, 3 family protein [Burkholderia pseudomallei]KGC93725.1 bacterial extracellular solute-binding s, 3 family protein [Burkholderia pseudomallei]KGW46474.1 bacterial extracellular solute-binding s, 3 family protein [Burkholderia pseudomallei MSHR684]OMW15088.1 glutamine ABC transporter substrate-binding protein GlnH [Burkholderia pseudomallei]